MQDQNTAPPAVDVLAAYRGDVATLSRQLSTISADASQIYTRLYRMHAGVQMGERGELDQWSMEQLIELGDCLDQLWNRVVMLPEPADTVVKAVA